MGFAPLIIVTAQVVQGGHEVFHSIRVDPMQIQIGDRITDETGEWEIIGRPFSTAAGKTVHARVRKIR